MKASGMRPCERLLVIGNGMASVRLCEELVSCCPGLYAITVVGAEPQPGYNRVLLSAHLAGDASLEDISLRQREWYGANGVKLITGQAVVEIDMAVCTATLADGTTLAFDRLVFATGSLPIRLPQKGMDLPGVISFRDLGDVATMQALTKNPGAKVVVIGGGLLGLEAAYGLARLGADVTLVHLMDRLMERQLDAQAGQVLKKAIERKGIRVLLQADTEEVLGQDHVTGLRLKDGRILPAEAIICAVGIRANAALAKEAGIATARGILVDDRLETSIPHVYALGECAEHRGQVYGLVEPAWQQAAVLAAQLAGETGSGYCGTVLSTHLKVSGVAVASAGDFIGNDANETIILRDHGEGVYRKLVIQDGRLTGAVMVGDTADAAWYRDLIREGTDISTLRRDIIFGREYCEGALGQDMQKVAA